MEEKVIEDNVIVTKEETSDIRTSIILAPVVPVLSKVKL